MGRDKSGIYPKLVLQFIRQGSKFAFECVEWWQPKSLQNKYEITVTGYSPTIEQIEQIEEKGSCITVNTIINDI